MSRRGWARTLALATVAALTVVFVGTSVPQCFAPPGGRISAACMAAWEAGWSLPERLVHTVGMPATAALTFAAVVAAAFVLARLRAARRQRPGTGAGP